MENNVGAEGEKSLVFLMYIYKTNLIRNVSWQKCNNYCQRIEKSPKKVQFPCMFPFFLSEETNMATVCLRVHQCRCVLIPW